MKTARCRTETIGLQRTEEGKNRILDGYATGLILYAAFCV